MKKFDLKNITEEDIFVGDLYIVTNMPFVSIMSTLAKKEAILIRVTEDYYIDLESIKSNSDIVIINELLSSNDYNSNNIILSDKLKKPYIGQLFIGSLEKVKENNINFLELKNILK